MTKPTTAVTLYRRLRDRWEVAEKTINHQKGAVEAVGAELKAAEAKLEKTSELISLYFEGCDCDEFDDRVRELRAAMEE